MLRSRVWVVVLLVGAVLMGSLPLSASAEGLLSMDSAHKYLGFGTIALAGATAVTNGDNDTHEGLAIATAACALSTVLTGIIEHSDRFSFSDGFFTRENLHIIAATVGAAALTTAVLIADDGEEQSHAGLGVTGGILMTVAVVEIKW